MKIGEALSPFWQNVVTVLLILGLGLTFVSALSPLWGWPVVGPISCAVLLALVFDERKAIRSSLTTEGKTADRLFAIYHLSIAAIATVVNVAVFATKLMYVST